MKMKSERPLLVNGVPQTEFETNDQHGRELIAKGLAVEFVPTVGECVNVVDEVEGSPDGKSMTAAELRDALTTKGVTFDASAKKADLQALLDGAQ